tara:strand:+ start:3290 stop:3406 length:117 start_codon:yes stop_codon:yes gene_type:complete
VINAAPVEVSQMLGASALDSRRVGALVALEIGSREDLR